MSKSWMIWETLRIPSSASNRTWAGAVSMFSKVELQKANVEKKEDRLAL